MQQFLSALLRSGTVQRDISIALVPMGLIVQVPIQSSTFVAWEMLAVQEFATTGTTSVAFSRHGGSSCWPPPSCFACVATAGV